MPYNRTPAGSFSGAEHLPAGGSEQDSLGSIRVVDRCHPGGVPLLQPALVLLALPLQVSLLWCMAMNAC